MLTHAQCLSSELLYASITKCILFAVNGIQVEATVRRTNYRKNLDEQVGQGVGEVFVEDREASVRTDPTDPSKVD